MENQHTTQPGTCDAGNAGAAAPTALLVLGMHRSGTSALTRTLSLLGAELPGHLIAPAEDNQTGFWESADIQQLNDRILAAAGASWDDWCALPADRPEANRFCEEALAILRRHFSESPLFVLKDPRFSRLLPFWLEALEAFGANTRCILALRDPAEVAASLRQRNGFSTEKGLRLWLRYTLDAERASRGLPRCFIPYDRLLADWRGAVATLTGALALRLPRGIAQAGNDIDAFLRSDLRHHRTRETRPVAEPRLARQVAECCAALEELCSTAGAVAPQQRLDRLRTELDGAPRAFAALPDEDMPHDMPSGRVAPDSEEAAALRAAPAHADAARATLAATGGEDAVGRFSVIMPTWNRCDAVQDAVASVLAQSYTDWELIVCDDGSTDSTEAALHERYADHIADGRIRYLRLQHRGASAARNAGLREARGQWIAYLDSDNRWHPDYLLITAAGYADHRDQRTAYACLHVHDTARQRDFIRCLPFDRGRLLAENFIDINTFSHHRALYERHGGFDEALTRLEDWDLVLRYTRENAPLFHPLVVCDYHLSPALDNLTLTEALEPNDQAVRGKFAAEWRDVALWNRVTRAAAEARQRRASEKHAAELRPLQERIEQQTATIQARDARIGELESARREHAEQQQKLEQGLRWQREQSQNLERGIRFQKQQIEALQRGTGWQKEQLSNRDAMLAAARARSTAGLVERASLARRLHAQRWRPPLWHPARRREATNGGDGPTTVPRSLPPLRLLGLQGGPHAYLRLIRQALALRGTGLFDADWYLLRYPDIALHGAHPLWHWLTTGWREGREPNPLFDTRWYLQRYPDVAEAGVNPLLHYLHSGALEGRRPGPMFDPQWYLATYKDVAEAGAEPLAHFLRNGLAEGREPGPHFNQNWYLQQYPDVAGAGMPPLWHYLLLGRAEGRSTVPPASAAKPAAVSAAPPQEKIAPDSEQARALQVTPAAVESARAATEGADIGRFSVIMPTWNRREIIERAIDSVLAQSWTDRELIVCDDGSTDGTGDHLRRRYAQELADGRMRYLALPHGGVCAARNAGLREATGRWIAWLDSDNAWHPDYLLMTAAGYARNPERRTAYACVHVHDEVNGREFIRCLDFDWHRLLARNYIDLNVFSHHRELYEALGGFDESLKRLVDWDLILRYTRKHEPLFNRYTLCSYWIAQRLGNITLTESLKVNEDAIRRKFADVALPRRPAPPPAPPPRPAPPATSPFRDFGDFERLSIFLQELRAPFSEEARRVIGHMRAVHRHLATRHAALPEDTLVSVVVTGGDNDPASVEATLRSVLAQTYANVEVIAAGGDRLAGIVEGLGDARFRHVHAPDGNTAAARNRVLAQARGDFIAWLDAPRTMAPDFLRILLGELLADDRFGLACCAQGLRATDGAGEDPFAAVRYSGFSRALLENRPYIDLGRVLCRRAAMQGWGGFDEDAPATADWAFLLHATENACPKMVPCLLSESRAEERPAPAPGRIDALLAKTRLAERLPAHRVPGLTAMYGRHGCAGPATPRPASVIIPSFECPEYLHLCVDSVRTFTDVPFELIVVDNASSPAVRDYLARIAKEEGVKVVQNEQNYGFTYAVNQGIALAAAGNDIVLLNNDAVVTPGWAGALQKVFEDIPDAGLAVPRQVLPPRTKTMQTHNPACDPAREMDVNLSLHHNNLLRTLDGPEGYVELSFAPFFCAYIPRRTLDETGPLDHESGPHYRSDVLYCEAVRRIAQRRVIYTPHAKLYHFLQQATTTLRSSDKDAFHSMFVRNEWSAIRGA